MWSYILRRLFFGIPTLLGVTIIVFTLLHLAPGDPISAMVPSDAPLEVVQMIRQQMGFDKPLPVQYWLWLTRVVQGDLGRSITTRRPVIEDIRSALGNTFILAFAAACLGFTLGSTLGSLAAFSRGRWLDKVSSAAAITGVSLPHYWVAIMLIIIFAVRLKLLPASGYGTWQHFLMPSLCLGMAFAPITMRLVRSGMIEVLSMDYIKTARSKGVAERRVVWKHAFRNASIPVVTVLGLQFGQLLGGAIITETVFAWPGVASLTVDSIRNQDFPVVQCAVVLLALIIVIVNLVVDVIVGFIDPRIRAGA